MVTGTGEAVGLFFTRRPNAGSILLLADDEIMSKLMQLSHPAGRRVPRKRAEGRSGTAPTAPGKEKLSRHAWGKLEDSMGEAINRPALPSSRSGGGGHG